MASAIRSLSSRGDLHAQIALARQELEAEKLTSHHLKAEVESYREIVDHNQKTVSTLRKELTAVKAIMNSVEALQSIQNIPGLSLCCH